MEFLPIEQQQKSNDDDDDDDDDERTKVRESLGVLSLEVYEIAFLDHDDDGTASTIEDLRERFGRALQTEVRHLSPPKQEAPTKRQQQQQQQQQQQRPSMKRKRSSLRLSGHRVSDAHVYYSISSSLKRTRLAYQKLEDTYGSVYDDDSTTTTTTTEDTTPSTTTTTTTTTTTPRQHHR